jgi:hypothetical protein
MNNFLFVQSQIKCYYKLYQRAPKFKGIVSRVEYFTETISQQHTEAVRRAGNFKQSMGARNRVGIE